MSEKTNRKPLALALGATFVAAMSVSPIASADSNPFGMQDLGSGYMQLAEGKCGAGKTEMEGKCSGQMKKEGKCGAAKCSGKPKATEEGKCSGKPKVKEEGKCGGKG